MNIYNYNLSEFQEYFIQNNENKAKATLIYNEIYKKKQHNLSARVTALIERDFTRADFEITEIKSTQDAAKFLYKLHDGLLIESVLMRHDYGNALCISTQVGCNMGCAFCRSGKNGKVRDLEPYEMVLQILKAEEALNERIPRVTLMGIGEPLDNFEHVIKFINIIENPHGLGIAPRHITISTCGLIPEIKQLLNLNIPCNLAVSLHAPNNQIRSKLMPINKVYGFSELIKTVEEFSKGGKKITLEYILLDGVNDSDDDARELVNLLCGLNCYLNIIPYNETALGFRRSPMERLSSFYSILIQGGICAVIRREFGAQLMAACGQLTCGQVKE